MMTSALFPPISDRNTIDSKLGVLLADAEERVFAGPVTPTLRGADLAEALEQYTFEAPVPLEIVLPWVVQALCDGIVHVNHPRYFGLFNPTPSFPAQCAERIVAAFNPQLASRTTSPAAADIEFHVLAALARRLGLAEQTRGSFTTGGAEANYTAVLLALCRADPAFASRGVRALAGDPVLYASRDSHLAWIKIARQAGLGDEAVHLIATDGSGRMDCRVLVEAIDADRASGRLPFLVVATAGTTNAGMIDPLCACASAAAEYGLWLHVDAAWGGALAASPHHRQALAGIERADSVTVDAHKWFATTMGCGVFLTCHPQLLSTAFHVNTRYMPSHQAIVDPFVSSVQWSRRFLGLRLFASLATVGWEGHAAHVEHSLTLAAELATALTARGWWIVNDSRTGVVCAAHPLHGDINPIVRHVLDTGRAWVSVATFEGSEVIRMCVTSGLTTTADIDDLVAVLTQSEIAARARRTGSHG
jgi:aromatic-L-amino-acid decarboxylase